jgi:uncharacterized protein (DUF1800 family)
MRNLLAPWQPSAQDPFDLRRCGHLLRRAGFGASLAVRRRLARAGLDAALQHVMPAASAAAPADALLDEVIAFGERARVRAFRVWVALQCVQPLRARMAVFWHDHFATSDAKVQDPRAMALQLATFDRLGLGRFDDLLLAMCRDPALLRWLDNDVNTRRQPNENFARELLELFALGRGAYTETDVREAARAFTGWHVRDGAFRFAAHLHDAGVKRVLGVEGPLGGEQVVAACVARDDSARFLATRWLQHFVHPEPEPAEIDALAACYREHDRDVGRTLAVLLRSRLFFSPRAYRSRIKSPADFVLGTVRALGGRAVPSDLARTMATLGEAWLEPPSVEGWRGERAWLSPGAWLLRCNFVADLVAGRSARLRPAASVWFADDDGPAQRAGTALALLLDGDASPAAVAAIEAVAAAHGDDAPGTAALLHAVACLPEYQLL